VSAGGVFESFFGEAATHFAIDEKDAAAVAAAFPMQEVGPIGDG
jgi:hypothetical protein